MPKVTEEHRAARRQQILDATLRCVAREGFHKTTMAHVITESGLSAGAVYGYFKGKPDLIRAIAERAVGGFADALYDVATGPGPVTVQAALEAVIDRVDGLLENTDGEFARVALHSWSEAARDPDVLTIVRGNVAHVRQGWERVLARAEADGTLSPRADRSATAAVLLSMTPGYVIQHLFLGDVDGPSYVAAFAALRES
jgi:AcrR family transcriptional regulator